MKIIFLTYLNRSGSTLLATKLDKFSNIGVTIEENWTDGIRRGKVKIKSESSLDHYLSDISKSSKFKFWNIDTIQLKEELIKCRFPISYERILKAIYQQYFADKDLKYVIHKNSSYFMYYKKVLKTFPNSKILFIDRDPRGIYNSQKKSIDSTTLKYMRRNPVSFAIYYKKSKLIVKRLVNKTFFHRTSYEDLLRNESEEIHKILKFIGISKPTIKNNKTDYYEKIPEEQKHLHNNLKTNGLITKRINAWENELEGYEIAFLQYALKKEIIELGFETKNIHNNNRLRFYNLLLLFSVRYSLSFIKSRIQILLGIL